MCVDVFLGLPRERRTEEMLDVSFTETSELLVGKLSKSSDEDDWVKTGVFANDFVDLPRFFMGGEIAEGVSGDKVVSVETDAK